MTTYKVRANSEEEIVFVLETDGLARDLSTAEKVVLFLIDIVTNEVQVFDTVSTPLVLEITGEHEGEVTFTPTTDIFDVGSYKFYLDAYFNGKHVSFPSTENYIFEAVESAYDYTS